MNDKSNGSSLEESMGAQNVSRREFLRLMGLLAGAGLAPAALIGCGPQPAAKPAAGTTPTPFPTVGNPGERVPEIVVSYQTSYNWNADLWRKIALDGEKIGFKYKLNGVSNSAWLSSGYAHTYGDMFSHANESNPYRDADPTEQVVVRLHSREAPPPKRNFGEYKNPEVDTLAEIVETELDVQKRKDAAFKIQDIHAKDYYMWCPVTGPNPICAYNSGDWEGVVSSPGISVGGVSYPWNWLSVRSKSGRKRLILAVGGLDYLAITNPFGPGGVRGVNSLYWDHYLLLDPELKTTPWVVTAWKNPDKLTWDLTIRDGMKWHDGRPATVEDVAFSFNYMIKWKPSFYEPIWSVTEGATVVDQRTVRLKTKQPAANMLTDLLLRAPLVAKHIWENLVENQNVKDPNAVKTDPSMIIGTGPFKFGHLTQDVELLLTANKDHWQPPKFDEFLHLLVPNLDSMLGKLEAKEIDFESEYLTPTQANRLKAQKHISTVESTRALNPFINPFFDHLPWRDPVFRRAWHRTVDKDYLANVIWEGAAKIYPFNTLMAAKHPFHNPDIKERFNYSVDEARKLLAEGGYSWDKEGRLLYPSPDNAAYKKRVEQAHV